MKENDKNKDRSNKKPKQMTIKEKRRDKKQKKEEKQGLSKQIGGTSK